MKSDVKTNLLRQILFIVVVAIAVSGLCGCKDGSPTGTVAQNSFKINAILNDGVTFGIFKAEVTYVNDTDKVADVYGDVDFGDGLSSKDVYMLQIQPHSSKTEYTSRIDHGYNPGTYVVTMKLRAVFVDPIRDEKSEAFTF